MGPLFPSSPSCLSPGPHAPRGRLRPAPHPPPGAPPGPSRLAWRHEAVLSHRWGWLNNESLLYLSLFYITARGEDCPVLLRHLSPTAGSLSSDNRDSRDRPALTWCRISASREEPGALLSLCSSSCSTEKPNLSRAGPSSLPPAPRALTSPARGRLAAAGPPRSAAGSRAPAPAPAPPWPGERCP